MTDPTARSVAKELDRLQRRRKYLMLSLVIAAIAAALSYLTCGQGFGVGGKGAGKGEGSGAGPGSAITVPIDAAAHCAIRVAADGITVDGTPAQTDAIIERCTRTKRAVVTVTGDARQGDWDTLRGALEAADIAIEKL